MEEIERQYLGLEEEQQMENNNCDQTLTDKGLNHQQQQQSNRSRTMGVRSRVGQQFWPSALLLLLIQITQNVIFVFELLFGHILDLTLL